MFQQMVVPLDGSELAERAVPVAARLAVASGATIHLVRVIQPLPPTWGTAAGVYLPEGAYDALLSADTTAATTYLESVRQRLAATDAPVRAVVLSGDIASSLLDYERDAGIDLVVMCSHGRSGLARFALGSIAARLLHHGVAPLLLVRAFGSPVTLEQAIVPLDGSAVAEEALPVVAHLADHVVRAVTLVRVLGKPEEGPVAERYLATVAAQVQHLAWARHVALGDPAQVILEMAGADRLVVMATHGSSGVARWAVGSVTDRVARGGAAAVLAVPLL